VQDQGPSRIVTQITHATPGATRAETSNESCDTMMSEPRSGIVSVATSSECLFQTIDFMLATMVRVLYSVASMRRI
jgi:hypothetical protein